MKDRLVAAWRAWAARVREARRWRNPPGGVGPRVYYGRERVLQRGEVAQGGIVKCQDLADLFPNTPRGPNLLYLVSSALPPGATAMARCARRAGARVVVNQDGWLIRPGTGPAGGAPTGACAPSWTRPTTSSTRAAFVATPPRCSWAPS